jgi:hypothetical protein
MTFVWLCAIAAVTGGIMCVIDLRGYVKERKRRRGEWF